MAIREEELAEVIMLIRKCFNQLKTLSDQLHEAQGVTASMRSVMEHLANHGSETVPRIAQHKVVTRQHIQTVINVLREKNFVEPIDNPAHRRSPLFRLSSRGEFVYGKMASVERQPLRDIAKNFAGSPLSETLENLSLLSQNLDVELGKVDGKISRDV